MARYEDFQYQRYSFEEMVGVPQPLPAAIGEVALSFSDLEQNASGKIATLLHADPVASSAVTAQLSFKAKLDLLASLIKLHFPHASFNVGPNDPEAALRELVAMLTMCEELRNRVMHSTWRSSPERVGHVRRAKQTARAKHGFRQEFEDLTPGNVLDISDYIVYGSYSLDEFFLGVDLQSQIKP
ncbi:MAG TPA: hypothetical protein VI729_01555 [Anaerolineales bacterium]|nr:hypothetical protein [Anaerolineales bacterium]